MGGRPACGDEWSKGATPGGPWASPALPCVMPFLFQGGLKWVSVTRKDYIPAGCSALSAMSRVHRKPRTKALPLSWGRGQFLPVPCVSLERPLMQCGHLRAVFCLWGDKNTFKMPQCRKHRGCLKVQIPAPEAQ